jgi:hypothetical protein
MEKIIYDYGNNENDGNNRYKDRDDEDKMNVEKSDIRSKILGQSKKHHKKKRNNVAHSTDVLPKINSFYYQQRIKQEQENENDEKDISEYIEKEKLNELKNTIDVNNNIQIFQPRKKNSHNKNELNFLIDYLYNQINYLNITIQDYLKDNTKELKMNLIQIQMQWGKYYKDMLNKKNIDLKTNDKNRPVIYDRRKSDIKNIDNHNNLNVFLNNIDDNKNNESELNLNFFSPNYMSYYPKYNNNIFFDSEPIWIMPSLRHNFIWENKLDLIK